MPYQVRIYDRTTGKYTRYKTRTPIRDERQAQQVIDDLASIYEPDQYWFMYEFAPHILWGKKDGRKTFIGTCFFTLTAQHVLLEEERKGWFDTVWVETYEEGDDEKAGRCWNSKTDLSSTCASC